LGDGGQLLKRAHEREEGAAGAFRLEDHLFFHFSQILARRTRAINARLRPYGVDYARWRVLAVLQEHSGATMGRLADLTSVDRTTLTRTLGLMEKAGLVARRERKSDRRSLAISLTAKGRRSALSRGHSRQQLARRRARPGARPGRDAAKMGTPKLQTRVGLAKEKPVFPARQPRRGTEQSDARRVGRGFRLQFPPDQGAGRRSSP
jgi:DNA-binding MarR family transcriptional regulator